MKSERRIIPYKKYFWHFYNEQTETAKEKIDWVLQLIKVTQRVPKKYFDHMTGTKGLYEIRVEVGSNIFRIFSFFDKGNLIILTNGFQKKTQKTPKNEIERAIKIMEEYKNEKEE